MNKIYFRNDYSEIACPEIIENIAKYSQGHFVGYGEDEICVMSTVTFISWLAVLRLTPS